MSGLRATVAFLTTSAPALAQAQDWERRRMHPMWGIWGLWGFAMMAMMLVFWGVVIAGIVFGIRWQYGAFEMSPTMLGKLAWPSIRRTACDSPRSYQG